MKETRVFIDTNILVYAYDSQAEEKQKNAAKLIEKLWEQPLLPSLSIQVLQEFYITLIRKKIKQDVAEKVVNSYLEWNVVENNRSLFESSFTEQKNFGLSFWDSCILAAARQSQCTELWSEDFNSGQVYDGIKVKNPLIKDR